MAAPYPVQVGSWLAAPQAKDTLAPLPQSRCQPLQWACLDLRLLFWPTPTQKHPPPAHIPPTPLWTALELGWHRSVVLPALAVTAGPMLLVAASVGTTSGLGWGLWGGEWAEQWTTRATSFPDPLTTEWWNYFLACVWKTVKNLSMSQKFSMIGLIIWTKHV